MGAKREFPDRESKPSTQHPHRTHDTTDQWREILLWLGRSRRMFLLSSPGRAFCVPVRASRCECGRVFEGRPSDACAAKGHRATAVEAKKRFFKCGAGNCGQRATTLNAPFPARACPRCRCEDWDKACASASAERAGREGERAFGEMVATREKMLARGVEHGFTLNSEPPAQGN